MPQPPDLLAHQPPDIIILGASARAAAQSAIRAGLRPWCADLFADRDLAAIAPAQTCAFGSYPMGLVELVKDARLPTVTPVLFTGAMENYPQATAALQAMHPVYGLDTQGMAVIRALARQPEKWTPIQGIHWPRTIHLREENLNTQAIAQLLESYDYAWLLKPIHGAAGSGIKLIHSSTSLPPDHLLQQYIQGRPVGAVFRGRLKPTQSLSPSSQCELLGVSEQIIGDAHFGAKGFGYVGSIGPVELTPNQTAALCELGEQIIARQPTAGLFGVDLMLDAQGGLWPVEINPRYTASVEVLERACDFAALNCHSSPQPNNNVTGERTGSVAGKAYVFAKSDSQAPDLYAHFNHDQIADVPHVGSDICKGHPICTLLASAESIEACRQKLREMAASLYSRLQ